MIKCEENEVVTIVGEHIGVYTQGSNGYVMGDTVALAKTWDMIYNIGG